MASRNYVPAQELIPRLRDVLRRHSDRGLLVSEIIPPLDQLVVASGETRLVHQAQVRIALPLMEAQGSLYSRTVRDGERPPGGTNRGTRIWSVTDPVPEWDPEFHQELLRLYPDARPFVPVQRRSRTKQEITELVEKPETHTGRAEIIVGLIRELAREADDGLEVEALRSRVTELESELTRIKAEKETAMRKLAKLARVLGD